MSILLKELDFNDTVLLNKLLEWRNDNITRYYSNNTNIITKDIFDIILNKYKESGINPLIIYYENNEVGIITFVECNNKIYMGINISPDYRNKKIGSLALNELIRNTLIYFNNIQKIYASIKKENVSSIKLFEKYFTFSDENNIFKEYYLEI